MRLVWVAAVDDDPLEELVRLLGDRRRSDGADSGPPDGRVPFRSAITVPGLAPVAPQRPECLGADDLDDWWDDVRSWVGWLVPTFRLAARFPPCWPQHPALVEELAALWLVWQRAWLPGNEPAGPADFLRELDLSLSRVDRWWRVPCTTDSHHPQPPVPGGAVGQPTWRAWWSDPEFGDADRLPGGTQ